MSGTQEMKARLAVHSSNVVRGLRESLERWRAKESRVSSTSRRALALGIKPALGDIRFVGSDLLTVLFGVSPTSIAVRVAKWEIWP